MTEDKFIRGFLKLDGHLFEFLCKFDDKLIEELKSKKLVEVVDLSEFSFEKV